MGVIVDIVEDVIDFVEDTVEWIGDAISDVADFVADEIIKPVGEFVGDTIDGLLDDPITTIAKITAVATGNAWAIPLIDGASVAMDGGDIGDVLKATAVSYVAGQVGGEVGSYAGDYVAEAVGSELVGEIVSEGATQAASAIIYGEDPMEAFLRGGISAGVAAGLGKIQESIGFEVEVTDPETGATSTKPIPSTVSNIVAAGLTAQLTGQEITPELMAGAVTRGLMTTELVADLASKGGISFDDPSALAYTTAAMQRVTAIALSGGSGEQAAAALQATLSAYGGEKFKEAIDNSKVGDLVGNTLDKISGDYQATEEAATKVNTIGLRRKADAEEYESMRIELKDEFDAIEAEKERIAGLPTNTEAQQTEYNKAVGVLNDRIEKWVSLRDDYQPRMETLVANIERDTGLLTTAEADLAKAQSDMNVSVARLDDELKPLNDELLQAVTLTMDPAFNENQYRALNNLGDDVDVYQHFLENGQYEGVYTNFEQFNAAQDRNVSAFINRTLNEAGIDPSSIPAENLQKLRENIINSYPNPSDIEAAINDESVVKDYANRFQRAVAGREDNPYRDATLTADNRARLAALGFDTSDGMDGDNLTNAEKAALYSQDNQGQATASLGAGVTWQDVASGKASVEYDENGNRIWRNVRVTETKYDPDLGRVNVSTVYDRYGRPSSVVTTDMNGNTVAPMRIHIYAGNSTATFGDALNGAFQAGGFYTDEDGNYVLPDIIVTGSLTQAAGDQLGGVDNAIGFMERMMNLAVETDNSTLINTTANVMKAGGGILKAFNGVSALFGVVPSDTALGQFSDKLVKLGEASNTEEYKQNLKELNDLMNRPSELDPDAPWYDRAFEKVENIAGAIYQQPSAFIAEYIGVEAMQELVPLAVGGVATLGAKGAAMAVGKNLSARMAATTGLSAAAATDIAESFGGTAAETYDRAYDVATKSGMSDTEAQEYAMNLAVETATVAATMTAVTLGAGGLALEKAILGKDEVGGFLARGIDELGTRIGNGAKITIKEGVTEGIEEGAATAYREGALSQIDPSINVSGEVAGATFMGFLIGGPISGGAYGVSQTGDMYSNLVSALNPEVNAIITNTPNTTQGIQNATNTLTDLGITGTTQTNILNSINDSGYTSTQESEATFQSTNPDYVPTQAEIDQFTVAGNADQTAQDILNHIDTRYVDAQEVIDAAAAQGVTITQEQAEQYVGQQDEASTLNTVSQTYDPLGTTAEEVRAKFAELGFDPTDAQVNQFVQEGNESDILAGINPYVDPRQVTETEARSFFDELGYNPTEQEVANFVGQGGENFETNAPARVETYVDPRQVTEDEARQFFTDLGYTPTDDQVAQFVAQVQETTQSENISKYVDPRQVTMDEVQAIADEEGLTLTEALAQTYIGQGEAETFQQTQLDAARSEYDPLATTQEEAAQFFESTGYTATPEEIAQFVASKTEEVQNSAIGSYVDPRQMTEAESREFLSAIGYNPTDEEVAQFTGQLNDENFQVAQQSKIDEYVDPRYFDASEVRAAYEELGLVDVTQEDVDRFVGQYDPETADYDPEGFEAAIQEELSAYAPTATFNIIRQYIGSPSVADDPNTEADESKEATGIYAALEAGATRDEALKGAIQQLSTDFGLEIGQVAEDVAAVKGEVTGLGADIQGVADLVGKPAQDVTQTDIDFVADVIAQNQVLNEQQVAQYDVTGDGIVDINDQTLLEQALAGDQVNIADTSLFAPTGVYGTVQDVQTDLTQQMEQNQEQTLDTIQQMEQNIVTNIEDEAMREGARNFLQAALQAPDAAGQQVTVKTPDPLQLRYLYDFSSIFANPSQQALFPSPYAKGGQVEDTTDKLLNIIGGK